MSFIQKSDGRMGGRLPSGRTLAPSAPVTVPPVNQAGDLANIFVPASVEAPVDDEGLEHVECTCGECDAPDGPVTLTF